MPTRMTRSRLRLPLPISGLLCLGCLTLAGCSGTSRTDLYPVAGSVRVNGRPAADAVVTLYPVNGPAAEEARPNGRADEAGHFTLTTHTSGDGAPAGEYRVTVTRIVAVTPANRPVVEGENLTVRNMIPTTYARPETTPLKVTIQPGATEPLVLDIKTTSR